MNDKPASLIAPLKLPPWADYSCCVRSWSGVSQAEIFHGATPDESLRASGYDD